ncbi:unnamed protein product, partial [Sphacelaria rigidula]
SCYLPGAHLIWRSYKNADGGSRSKSVQRREMSLFMGVSKCHDKSENTSKKSTRNRGRQPQRPLNHRHDVTTHPTFHPQQAHSTGSPPLPEEHTGSDRGHSLSAAFPPPPCNAPYEAFPCSSTAPKETTSTLPKRSNTRIRGKLQKH